MGAISSDNREVQKRICKALGLDPGHVRSLEIKLHPGEAVRADVEMFVQDDQLSMICLELKECKFEVKL